MIKASTKALAMVIASIIFTFNLIGYATDVNDSQSEISQPEISLQISSASETFFTEELEIAKKQLPTLLL